MGITSAYDSISILINGKIYPSGKRTFVSGNVHVIRIIAELQSTYMPRMFAPLGSNFVESKEPVASFPKGVRRSFVQ